jgi:hypothetical protein
MVAAPSRPFHWPGGIPNEIQVDANGDITPEQANEEAKGWLLFVEVSHSAPDFACFSRRGLIIVLIFDGFRNNGSPVRLPTSLMKMAITRFANDEH